MADNKKYYYLKLKDNFYDRPEIKAIESMESGYEYISIMQKMYLRSLEREGKLMLTDTIPYDIKILSKVLGHRQDVVEKAVKIFVDLKLCKIMDDRSIYMTEIQKYIGHSSTEADRIREYRRKIDNVQIPYKCTPELELDIESDKEIKIKKDNIKQPNFIPPSLEELTNYLTEHGYTIDAMSFIDYYEARGWMLGKVKMRNWRAAVRTWVKNQSKYSSKTGNAQIDKHMDNHEKGMAYLDYLEKQRVEGRIK